MNVEDFLKENKPKIEKIKYIIIKSKELEDGVILYLENREKIHLSVDTFFTYSISSLQGLDDDLYEKLKYEEKLYLSYKSALRKLAIKDFSIKQIKDFLIIKKDLNKNEADNIINELVEYGLLDDDKYCLNRANYLNKQLLSFKQIKLKLAKEGISSELIDKYVIIKGEDEYIKANKLASKYSNSIKNKSLNAKKQGILTKLVNAGYGYETSKEAVNSLNLENDNESELLKKDFLKAKKKYEKKYEDYDLKNHIYSYLINKGFKSEDIKKVMED